MNLIYKGAAEMYIKLNIISLFIQIFLFFLFQSYYSIYYVPILSTKYMQLPILQA